MKFKKILLITLLLLAIFTMSAVSATDNLTDDGLLQENPSEEIELSEDVNNEIVSSSQQDTISEKDNGTFTALQTKINNAQEGSTITLENDYAYDDGFDIGGINISKSLTIDGNNHIIDAKSKSRIFFIDFNLANVILKNIIFIGGKSNSDFNWDGGAIENFADSCSIISCNFKDCYAEHNGGAISALCENFNIISCNFENCHAGDDGGAIYMGTFSPDEYKLNVQNCVFTNNKAEYSGAAIMAWCGSKTATVEYVGEVTYYFRVKIKDSKFTNNNINNDYVISLADYETIFGNGSPNGYAEVINCIFDKEKKYAVDDLAIITNCKFKSSSSSSSSNSKNTKLTPKLIVKKATFKAKAKSKKYSAILKTNKNKAMKKVKLYLKVRGKTYTAKTNSKGKATFKIKNLKKKGTYKATVTFKGNKNYKKVTKTVKIKVK